MVFEKDDFIAWANENVVTMVGHNGATGGKEDHKPTEVTDPKTKEKKSVCPSYVDTGMFAGVEPYRTACAVPISRRNTAALATQSTILGSHAGTGRDAGRGRVGRNASAPPAARAEIPAKPDPSPHRFP